jgi:hypothetical protein
METPAPNSTGTSGQAKEKSWERGTRWQKNTLDQLGYALNLILTFTIAALGYCFVLLKDASFTPSCSAKCAFLFSLGALALSAICGIFCVLTRLWDFRETARRARNDPEALTKEEVRALGRRTWVFFYIELAAFALGVTALAITLLLTYGRKLV